MIFACFAALIPAGFIAYLALSKKTSPMVKKVSIIALILIGISFAVCTIILLVMFGSPVGIRGPVGDLPVVPVQEAKQNIIPILVAVGVFFFFLILVIILAIREQRRK